MVNIEDKLRIHALRTADPYLRIVMSEPACWKHEEDLTIRYTGVRSVTTDPGTTASHIETLGDVVLDESVPHEYGCCHEIMFLAGSLTVISANLTATWVQIQCPQR